MRQIQGACTRQLFRGGELSAARGHAAVTSQLRIPSLTPSQLLQVLQKLLERQYFHLLPRDTAAFSAGSSLLSQFITLSSFSGVSLTIPESATRMQLAFAPCATLVIARSLGARSWWKRRFA
jgi:hypothetical protein